MIIQIQVIDVSPEQTTKTAKGGYGMIEVAYKKDGKVEGKKLMSFVHPEVYKAAKEFKSGDVVNVEIGKEEGRDGKEYWQWQRIVAGGEESTSKETSATQPTSSTPTSKPVSNYETKEERQARQVMIVRQSSLSTAVALAAANGGKKSSSQEIITTAKEFEAFVMGTNEPVAFVDIADDVPQ